MILNRAKYFFVSYNGREIINAKFEAGDEWLKNNKLRKVKDNIIINNKDVTDDVLGCDRENYKDVFFDETMNIFFCTGNVANKNFELEQLKMDLRIAKYNSSVDPKNKYYLERVNSIEKSINEL